MMLEDNVNKFLGSIQELARYSLGYKQFESFKLELKTLNQIPPLCNCNGNFKCPIVWSLERLFPRNCRPNWIYCLDQSFPGLPSLNDSENSLNHGVQFGIRIKKKCWELPLTKSLLGHFCLSSAWAGGITGAEDRKINFKNLNFLNLQFKKKIL